MNKNGIGGADMYQWMWIESKICVKQVKGRDVFLSSKGQEKVYVTHQMLVTPWPIGLIHIRKSKVLIYLQVTETILLSADG